MTHTSQGTRSFAEHFIGLLKNTGDAGDTGDEPDKSFNSKDKSVTKFSTGASPVKSTGDGSLSPVKSSGDAPPRATGDAFIAKNQKVIRSVTTVTTVTSNFAEGAADESRPPAPAEWHAIAAGLKACRCPDWLSIEAWETLLSDADNFLQRWGSSAESLGWTSLDLFGVHPRCPDSRFDVMGLMPVIRGATVTALTAEMAALHRASGGRLTYRRHSRPGAVLLSDLRKAESLSIATKGSAA